MAEILIHNGKVHIRSFPVLKDIMEGTLEISRLEVVCQNTLLRGEEAFQALTDALRGFSPKVKTGKEKPVEGVSRAPVRPESKGGGGISKEEMRKIKQIIKEVTTDGK